LLYKKQITPPFKPIVDSDESVANFDPEFTNSTLADAGVDEEEINPGSSSRHNYLGPGMSMSESQGQNKAMNISKAKRPGMPGENDSPLTESVQENFRGFTYTGESVMVSHQLFFQLYKINVQPHSMLADYPMDAEHDEDDEHAVDDDEDDDGDDVDSDEDDEDMDGSKTRRQSDVEME